MFCLLWVEIEHGLSRHKTMIGKRVGYFWLCKRKRKRSKRRILGPRLVSVTLFSMYMFVHVHVHIYIANLMFWPTLNSIVYSMRRLYALFLSLIDQKEDRRESMAIVGLFCVCTGGKRVQTQEHYMGKGMAIFKLCQSS